MYIQGLHVVRRYGDSDSEQSGQFQIGSVEEGPSPCSLNYYIRRTIRTVVDISKGENDDSRCGLVFNNSLDVDPTEAGGFEVGVIDDYTKLWEI